MEEKNVVVIQLTGVSKDQIKKALISAIESLVEKQSQIVTSETPIEWKDSFILNFEKSSVDKHIQHLGILIEQFD